MKNLTLLLLTLITLPAYTQNKVSEQEEAIAVLQKASEKLNSLTTFTYNIRRELNYSSEGYRNTAEWSCYFHFDTTAAPIGFKYQVNNPAYRSFYNGTEKFDLDSADKTIQLKDNPVKEDFLSLSFLYNSIVTLKHALPLLIKDLQAGMTVSDTLIDNRTYAVVTINMGKRRIQNLGKGFDAMQTESNFIYVITFDKVSQLPVAVLQQNDANDDFIRTDFSNINFMPEPPAELSWYYSTYTKEYKLTDNAAFSALLPPGSHAPEWKLQDIDNQSFTLSNFKGKVVLLDFWIKNCGPCVSSVPHLNKISRKFQHRDFELVSINSYDSKEDIARLLNKHPIEYQVLLNGKAAAASYGVYAFPTLFIINKRGEIIYFQTGFDASSAAKIEQIIDAAL